MNGKSLRKCKCGRVVSHHHSKEQIKTITDDNRKQRASTLAATRGGQRTKQNEELGAGVSQSKQIKHSIL